MEQIERRKTRIKILLALLVIGGFFWYTKFGAPAAEPYESTGQELQVADDSSEYPMPILVEGPSPDSFEIFTLPASGIESRSMVCGDVLYAVLVFPAEVDYRRNPRGFVYNSATPCPKGDKILVEIAKEHIRTAAGEYYLVVADQGASGSWYNPR